MKNINETNAPLFWLGAAAASCGLMMAACSETKPASSTFGVVTTSYTSPRTTSDAVVIEDSLRASCDIPSTADAPRFAFDSVALAPAGRGSLQQLAHCLTEGRLRGRSIDLVGRADPRGEEQYNMALGGYRAQAVAIYLHRLGVPLEQLGVTSRGELDARGVDPVSWAADRRVDITLGPQS